MNVETVLQHYLVCALWSSTDEDGEPLDKRFEVSDVSEQAKAQSEADITDFLGLLEREGVDVSDLEEAQFGHDFWLTRNHHGAGFWDRGLGERGDLLTKWAHTYGEVNPYVADDGKVDIQ